MPPSYQLTRYPIGSKRECLALAWPLMTALISTSLMIFIDRLYLAHFDLLALNAAASSGMAYYMLLVLPMGIAAITEVLVGRLHGEGCYSQAGSATWQMIWFSIFLTPLFWLLAALLPPLLFAGSGNELYESLYFQMLMLFAPLQCTSIALSGFFIGIGKVATVTMAALFGNLVNTVLGYLLIFGGGGIPSWGMQGAALATGLSQLMQTLFLLARFWSYTNRVSYGTCSWAFHSTFLWMGLKLGAPAGFGHSIELLAHFLFFRILIYSGPEQMTIAAMVQSFYILSTCVTEAESKAASAVVANLLGAKVVAPIGLLMRSAFSLHGLYFALFLGAICLFPHAFLALFSSSEEYLALFAQPHHMQTFFRALICMSFFFLFDGLGWILIGFLTAAGDSRFVFFVSLFVHWFAYVLPTIWFIGVNKGGADIAWGLVAAMSVLSFTIYFWRYLSGAWLKQYQPEPQQFGA